MASYWHHLPGAVPPFAGAPPIPAGVNIPVQHWNGGHWIPNPHFNPLAAVRPGPAWMPSHAWHLRQPRPPPPVQQQQQQQVNPYKRQPREPSAEYLASKLSDNPLGLSNMIPAEELERRREREHQHEKEQAEAEASTPWLWNPRTLDADSDADSPKTNKAPESYTSKGTLQPTFSANIVRTPEYYAAPRQPSYYYSSSSQPSATLHRHNSMPVSSHALSPLVFPVTPNSSFSATTTTQPLVRHTTLPASHFIYPPSHLTSPPPPPPPPTLSSSPPPLLHSHPRSNPRKRRKGFWNRRGDHVTSDGYVVYAPGPHVYPKDLDDYPDGKDAGYRNEMGMKAAWAPRPELTPKDGYQSLIEWVTID